jgi:hypothetical protein
MLRRIAYVVLLFVGIAPAVWAVCVFSSDPRRAAVLAGLAVLGLGLNGVALAKPGFGIRGPLRVIACGVGLTVLASVMAMWHQIRTDYLPRVSASGDGLAERFALAAGNLLWIAGTVAYVLLTVLLLPRPAKRSEPPGENTGGRVDFRKRVR